MDNDVKVDIIQNGGSLIADTLIQNGMDLNAWRPFIDPENNNGKFITNANGDAVPVTNATLLKDEWIYLDTAVQKAAQDRLRLVADLQARGLTFNLPNAMGKTIMQYQNQSDISDAQVNMDGISKSDADRPEFDLTSLPLPIIHKDFYYTLRELTESRNSGMPLDVSTAELASRKVSEVAEKFLSGTYGSYVYGGGTIYGYQNFPSRITTTVDSWADSSSSGEDKVNDVMAMKTLSRNAKHYGPWVLYVSSNYERYLEEDYKAQSDITVRERIMKLEGIQDIVVADYLSDNTLVLVQVSNDVVQEVVGFNPTTIQWQTEGGLKYNFKVMAILVPRLRADYNGNTGIVHATGT